MAFCGMKDEELANLDPTLRKGPLTKLRTWRDLLRQEVLIRVYIHVHAPYNVYRTLDIG